MLFRAKPPDGKRVSSNASYGRCLISEATPAEAGIKVPRFAWLCSRRQDLPPTAIRVAHQGSGSPNGATGYVTLEFCAIDLGIKIRLCALRRP